jgi:tRNA pseudouridine55 synthase
VAGKRLYKMAKQGTSPVELPTVTSTISDIKLLEKTQIEIGEKMYPLLKLEISCSSGTYIRSIANHLGEKLGTKGVLYSLIRTKVGSFNMADSQRLE